MSKISENRLEFFLYFMSKQKRQFAAFFVACFAAALSGSGWPYIIGLVVDRLSAHSGDKSNVFYEMSNLFLMALGFWLIVEMLNRAQGFIASYIYPKLEASIRMEVFEYASSHSYTYFSNNFVGSIANRISDLPRSSTMILDIIFTNIIPLIVAILISSILFLSLQWELSLVLICWLLAHMCICILVGSKAARLAHAHSEARTQLQGRIVDTLNNHLNVKLYTKQYFEVKNVQRAQEDEKDKNSDTLFFVEKAKVLLGLLAFIMLSFLMYITVRFWQSDIITLGETIFVFNTTLNILVLAWSVTIEMSLLFREMGIVKQALKIVQDPVDVYDIEDAHELVVRYGKIEFIKVTFKYRRSDNVFKEKTLTIDGGQKVGLVGLSGSGKTTFAHLILRLFNIDSGQILIDGQDISSVTLKSLRDSVCMIPQEPMLFHRSIMENIRYSSEDATDEEVIEAAIKANCHEFVMNMDDGYDTVVGDKASKISGGQKQRIAIARAMLKDAPILIMDEATSALDSYTEQQIKESLKLLSNNKTTIIIAHKLSTLLEMDRILVFDKGTIVEDGNHAELISKNGYYATLWTMQTAGLLPTHLEK